MLNRITPEELGRELRQGYSPFLKRRRGIIGLCFFSCGVLGAIALYQIGILKKLPEPRGRAFDTEKVNGSGQAYSILATPDAFLGLASYAVTAALVGMGPETDRERIPGCPLQWARSFWRMQRWRRSSRLMKPASCAQFPRGLF